MIQHAGSSDREKQPPDNGGETRKAASTAAAAGDSLVFQGSPEPTLGIEVELAVLERDTGELAPGSPRILAACKDEGIDNVAAELMQSMIEVRTGKCTTIAEARDELVPRLRRVRNIARSLGYNLAFLATHPSAKPNENVLFPDDRYATAGNRLAWMIYHRVTFGLHVHVGVRSGDEAVALTNLLIQYLPHVLALSANSPFWQGVDTGLHSARAVLYGLVPSAGVPPHFENWKDFRAYCQTMRDCDVLRSHKDVKWDIRPRADLGTIEFRVCDMPSSVAHVLALAALIRSMVVFGQRLHDEKPQTRAGDERRHWITVQNKWLAARYGLEAVYIGTPTGRKKLLRQEVNDLIKRLLPIARERGDDAFLAALQPIDGFEPGAQRQRHLYRDAGTWKAVIDDFVMRLEGELAVKEAAVSS